MIIRHDIKPDKYLGNAVNWPALFPLHRQRKFPSRRYIWDCAATLIHPNWAITAAHCTAEIMATLHDKEAFTVKVAGRENTICEVVTHPLYGEFHFASNASGKTVMKSEEDTDDRFDIALLRLSEAITDTRPMLLFNDDKEVGCIVELPGWGDFGTGKRGVIPFFTPNDGLFRIAYNRVTDVHENRMFFDFDHPDSPKVLPLEGVPGPGDSGGPAVVKLSGEAVIIGISSGGFYPDKRGFLARKRIGCYGWRECFVRVSVMKSWIDSIIEPTDLF